MLEERRKTGYFGLVVLAQPAYVVDPDDPRAPSMDVWACLTETERQAVLDQLPSEAPYELYPPEGDDHREAREEALDELRSHFRRLRRRIYLSSELTVYYPDETRFVPDLLAVLDVEDRKRSKWVVNAERKGLDLVLEIAWSSHTKDLVYNVERYARLGIPEYFVLDLSRGRLHSFRLATGESRYDLALPQGGRWPSAVLGLDLAFAEGRLRFHHGNAELATSAQLLDRANRMLDEVLSKHEEMERLLAEEQRRAYDEQRRREEEQRRREDLEGELAEVRAELQRLQHRQ